jgi:hypothetical protein
MVLTTLPQKSNACHKKYDARAHSGAKPVYPERHVKLVFFY